MALVRYATICDHCQSRSPEYEAYPHCRKCGDDICPACSVPETVDDESNTALCRRCERDMQTINNWKRQNDAKVVEVKGGAIMEQQSQQQSQSYIHGMKSKTIKAVISKKITQWLDSIENVELRKLAEKNVIVTGGCITSMLLGEPVNDFDIYFRDHDTTLAIATYYLSKFKPRKVNGIEVPLSISDEGGRIKVVAKSSGVVSDGGADKPYQYFEMQPSEGSGGEYIDEVIENTGTADELHEQTEKAALDTIGEAGNKDKPKYRPVFMTSNAITLSDKIQVILRFYGDPDTIHENYDYVHCTCYWTSWNHELVLRPTALEAMLARELRYVRSKYPICSLVRLRKFIGRGWRVNAGQILKICMQVSELNLKDIRVLEDQLTGVDTAYFIQLIERLKEKDPEKIDCAYLVELIDRIF